MTRTTTIVVRRRLRARPEALYRTLVDSRRLARVRGVAAVRVLAGGQAGEERVGTRRRVELPGGAYLVEELVDLAPPYRFDYRIREATVPFEHRYGRIEFRPIETGTEALWISEFAVPGRLGAIARPLGALGAKVAFAQALRGMDRVALDRTG